MALTISGADETAATLALPAASYSDQFTKAVFQICPDVLRTSGASFEDSLVLTKLGFKYTAQSEALRKIFDYRQARSDLLDITYVPKSKIALRTSCMITFNKSSVSAKDIFIGEWKKLAIKLHPKNFDEAKIYKKGLWLPRLITVTDDQDKPLYIIQMGYSTAREKFPETYSLALYHLTE